MTKTLSQLGFTAVELLITLFIGFLFISMGYQLYAISNQAAGDARETSKANNIAYEKLRKMELTGTGTSSCSPPPPVATENVDNNAAVMTTTVSCPSNSLTPRLRLVVVKVQYNVSQREIHHAMYVIQN